MTKQHRRGAAVGVLVGAALLAAATAASANPKPLPFTYTFQTLPEGDYEIEIYGDFTPVKALSSSTGDLATYLRSQYTLEVEAGLTDHLELGLYVGFAPSPGETLVSTPTSDDGFVAKQRLRGRFVEPGDWPIDVSLYGEVVEKQREIELEGKVNLLRRFGPISLVANLSSELEFYFDAHRDYVLNPSAGVIYEVVPAFTAGLEYWTKVEFADFSSVPEAERPAEEEEVEQTHYLGPTILVQTKHVWWSNGLYFRLSDITEPVDLGAEFGRVYVRSIIGISP
jgi:hypothetical protein